MEMDERVGTQFREEQAEREQYHAKLTAIESSLEKIRRQIFRPEALEDGSGLQEMLLEAEAMEEVRRRSRVGAR